MTIRRLSVYTRCLLQLEEDGVSTISSQELAERFNLNSAQVRKDLAYFGEFGVRGIGYYVSGLKASSSASSASTASGRWRSWGSATWAPPCSITRASAAGIPHCGRLRRRSREDRAGHRGRAHRGHAGHGA
jgi:hypothetical protein